MSWFSRMFKGQTGSARSPEDVIRFFQELEGGRDADPVAVVQRCMDDHGHPPDPAQPWDDVFLLAYAEGEVWADDPEADVCAGNKGYPEVLPQWAHISGGAFEPGDISEHWDSEVGPIAVAFESGGRQVSVSPGFQGDGMDLGVLRQIHALIAPSGRQFECAVATSIALLVKLAFAFTADAADTLERVRVSDDRRGFVLEPSGRPFVPWGFNYDHDEAGRLIEDYWDAEWPKVEEDFREMKQLGANVVRVHLQFGRFMAAPAKPDEAALRQLSRLVKLAERTGLYLDLTGLGCYHRQDVPKWYDALGEKERWEAQARFWKAAARACARSPAIFCYDLMNEPILPGNQKETDWLAGELAGKFFVQRITLDLAGRTREEVAKAWVETLVAAVRSEDERRLITVGVIPWALTFPGARPLFHSKEVGAQLDFASVHFYPKKDQIDQALEALAVYDVGKPLVIEELFPLACGMEQLADFIQRSSKLADGWIGFYWGRTIEEYKPGEGGLGEALTRSWLEYFRDHGPGGTPKR